MNIKCLQFFPSIKENPISNLIPVSSFNFLIPGLKAYLQSVLRNSNNVILDTFKFKRVMQNVIFIECAEDITIILKREGNSTDGNILYKNEIYNINDVYNLSADDEIFDMAHEYLRVLESPDRNYGCVCPICGEVGIQRLRDCIGTTFCKNNHSWVPQGYSGIKYKF